MFVHAGDLLSFLIGLALVVHQRDLRRQVGRIHERRANLRLVMKPVVDLAAVAGAQPNGLVDS